MRRLVNKDWVKPGAFVIDVGVNDDPNNNNNNNEPTADSTSTSTQQQSQQPRAIVGDVDFEEVKKVAGWITPVPGGVGPITVAMLIKNTLMAAIRSEERRKSQL